MGVRLGGEWLMRPLRRWRWRLWGLLFEDGNAAHEAAMDIDHSRIPKRPLGAKPPDPPRSEGRARAARPVTRT